MRRTVGVSGLVLAGAVALANSGCLAVAVGTAAAGGAAGYAYFRGNVSQDVAVSFNDTYAATQGALLDLGLPLVAATYAGKDKGRVESLTGDGETIRISVEARSVAVPADGPVTRVTVRVGMLGDRPLSDRLIAQIEARLASPPPQTAPQQTAPPPLGAPVTQTGGFSQTPPPPLAAPAQSWDAPRAN